jgi:deoxyribodipyrimidine photo-lyase
LAEIGSQLIIRRVDATSGQSSLSCLESLIKETGAQQVVWNRRYEPMTITRDTEIKSVMKSNGIAVQSFNGNLLFEPTELATQQGKPFQVFTPFWKACLKRPAPAEPTAAPKRLVAPATWPKSVPIDQLQLLPRINWDREMRDYWVPGETGALARLNSFLTGAINGYKEIRNFPAQLGSSLLSAHLHFGEISPRTIWHAIQDFFAKSPKSKELRTDVDHFLSEVGWREFAHQLLYHFPHTDREPLRAQYAKFPWRNDAAAQADLRKWQRGLTGYPIVDAGMRQLWRIGWMHNRVRMIVASFLVKDLLISWQQGAAWFWDTLLDADLASNTLGWQWTAGCGADAAPYFRIFNPVSQGEKFDANGEYIRHWCPELAALPNDVIHAPWTASAEQLRQANIKLGETYPHPMIDHAGARHAALAALATLKE